MGCQRCVAYGAVAWNPYLDEWAYAHGSQVYGWMDRESGCDRLEQQALARWRDAELNRREARTYLIRKYAFGVPGEEALACLAGHAPIVEMGAGIGYWARCLRERGVDVVAYDEMDEQWRAWFRPFVLEETETRLPSGMRALVAKPDPERSEPVLWTEVLKGGPRALAGHADHTLLLCWPDLWSGFDEASLREYLGERVAYVGEAGDERTGTEGFRRLLRDAWSQVDEAPVPQWDTSEDHLMVYERRRRRDTSTSAPTSAPAPSLRSHSSDTRSAGLDRLGDH